jgi:hypothetical protein
MKHIPDELTRSEREEVIACLRIIVARIARDERASPGATPEGGLPISLLVRQQSIDRVKAASVRLFARNGSLLGMGFLVNRHLAVTCTHLLNEGFGIPEGSRSLLIDSIDLDLPFLAGTPRSTGHITQWVPVLRGKQSGDIALLTIEEVPDEAQELFPVASAGYENGRFYVHGCNIQASGVMHVLTGRIGERTEQGWIRVHDESPTVAHLGFNGAPVFAEDLNSTIGMLTTCVEAGSENRYIIPADLLESSFPALTNNVLHISEEALRISRNSIPSDNPNDIVRWAYDAIGRLELRSNIPEVGGGAGGYKKTPQFEMREPHRPPPIENRPTLEQILPDIFDRHYSLEQKHAQIYLPSDFPAKSTYDRKVSTGFSELSDCDEPIDSNIPLSTNTRFLYWVQVGKSVKGSLDEGAPRLPNLPRHARLKVVVFGFPGGIHIESGADVGELELQENGSARVRTPAFIFPPGVHPSVHSKKRLFFPIKTPEVEGSFAFRCNIYFNNVLLQSRLVRARVMLHPEPVEGALLVDVDYACSTNLEAAQLRGIKHHRLSLMVNDNPNGTHSFRFVGEKEYKQDACFDANELQTLLETGRSALQMVSWGVEKDWKGEVYRYEKEVSLDELKKDLTLLAIRGYRFYSRMTQEIAGGIPHEEELAERLREPGFIEIASKYERGAVHLVLPAALIYDYPLETNNQIDSYELCRQFVASLEGHVCLEDTECFRGKCPSRGRQNLICPSGFWGFRHYLSLPLHNPSNTGPVLTYKTSPCIAVSAFPGLSLWPDHRDTLHTLVPGIGWECATTRSGAMSQLRDKEPHIVYFYCHGGVKGTLPYLLVGSQSDPGITPDNLLNERVYWKDRRPLVFINGCHTTALEPKAPLDFVNGFITNSNAIGVIGTEITVFEPLAKAFGEECLRHFLKGKPIAVAVQTARLRLLERKNPLGLAYVPFVVGSLHLEAEG